MKQTLFLMLGYPGSGKTTFSRQLARAWNIPRVSSDELRRYMYADKMETRNPKNIPIVIGALSYAAERLLEAGQSVICDVNSNQRRNRAAAAEMAAKYGAQTVVLHINTGLEAAFARELERTQDPEYLPIPPKRYQEIAAELEEPTVAEAVVTIDGLATFNQQLQAFETQFTTLGGQTSQAKKAID